MIRRYLGWRNRHADDEQLPEIVARAQVAEAALEPPEPAMRQSCAAERAAGGSFCRTGPR